MDNGKLAPKLRNEIRSLWSVGALGLGADPDLLENYIQGGDRAELAFAALVERHRRTVLQICRNVLGDCHLAADSFQVTFLILARRADSIRDPTSLEHWLHRVARRVAIRARAAADRRKLGQFSESAEIPVNHGNPLEHDEIRAIVREEIDRLDDALRNPIMLCALEGLTHEEAAKRLQWPVGTVKSRLVRGRRQLKSRLARRGLAPAVAFAIAGPARASTLVTTPRVLAAATTRVVFGGPAGAGAFTTSAAWLLGQELRAMTFAKFKIAAATFTGGVAVMLFGVAMAGPFGQHRPPLAAQSPGATEIAARSTRSHKSPQDKDQNENVGAAVKLAAHGHVVDAAGRPVAGASVFIREWAILRTTETTADESEERLRGAEIADILGQTTTGNDGRFQFQNVAAPAFRYIGPLGKGYYPWDLVAIAPGHGLAWTRLTNANQRTEIALKLPVEGILRGRLVETQGRPIAAARIKVFAVYPLGYLNPRLHDDPAHLDLTWSSIPLLATTGPDGTFTLRGLPRAIQTCLVITEPHHERKVIYAATTSTPQLAVSSDPGQRSVESDRVYPEEFTLTLKSTDRRLVGHVVLDATGKPAAWAEVSLNHRRKVTADADGKFVLESLPAGDIEMELGAPTMDAAPVSALVKIPESSGTTDQTFRLPPAMVLCGRVVDAESGAGISDAVLTYRARLEPGQEPTEITFAATTTAGGRFRLAAPPGRGVLEIRELPALYPIPRVVRRGSNIAATFTRELGGKACDKVDVPSFRLNRGKPVAIVVRDPEGRPVVGAGVAGVNLGPVQPAARTDAQGRCELYNLDRENGFTLDVTDPTRPLGRRVAVGPDAPDNANSDGTIEVKLEPCGSLIGRVLDIDGRPTTFAVARLWAVIEYPTSGRRMLPTTVDVQDDGTFKCGRLIAGVSYRINILDDDHVTWLGDPIRARPGDIQNLGEIRLPRADQQASGVVVDARGRGVGWATVGFERDSGRDKTSPPTGSHWFLETDGHGRFRLSGLPTGTINLLAYRRRDGDRSDRQTIHVQAHAGATDVRIVLPDIDDRLRGVE